MIVPIFDMRGRVVAFSGRAVTKEFSGGKYVNYRNTKVFEKGKVLYAANFVKKEKQKVAIDRVIVVEGYMDVISLAKYGFNNAIAGMGTAFTPEQARALRTLSENVCVCYDGDAAGQHATVRNLEILNKEGLNLKVVSIPENGMDPDDYVKSTVTPVLKNFWTTPFLTSSSCFPSLKRTTICQRIRGAQSTSTRLLLS